MIFGGKSIRILIHLMGWVAFLLFPFLFFLPIDTLLKDSPWVLAEVLLIDALCVSFYYFNYAIAVPRYFFTKKYVVYLLILTGWLSTIVLIRTNLEMYPSPPTAKGGFMGTSGVIVFRFIIIAVISFSERTYHHWKKTEAAKLKAELSYLKAQINPHFLFNTLNTIYTLVLKKADDAADAVIKLSSIMRYVISEAEHDMVPLEKEINYLSDYIKLQQLRLPATIRVDFRVSGEIDGRYIAPLILLPFMENAFKHGISMEEESAISIHIVISDRQLLLQVINQKVKSRTQDVEKSGKGIANSRQRLNLIYPGKHTLLISETNYHYKVELNIDIS